MIHGLVGSCNRLGTWKGRSAVVVLAGIATVILVFSEIVAIAPTRDARRLRRVALWCAVPVLVVFAAVWLVHIRGTLSQTP
jgi:hypothetical protein